MLQTPLVGDQYKENKSKERKKKRREKREVGREEEHISTEFCHTYNID